MMHEPWNSVEGRAHPRSRQCSLQTIYRDGGVSIQPNGHFQSRYSNPYVSMKGFLTIDLFASKSNHQLPVYCSREQDDRAFACNALSIDWTGMAAYAYPPISLLPKVLLKIEREDCVVVLIAPRWPRQTWFHALLQLMVDVPLSLPEDKDTISECPGPSSGFTTSRI